MRTVSQIAEEVRRALGDPDAGPGDDLLLLALDRRRRAGQRRRRIGLALAASLLLLCGGALFFRTAAAPMPSREPLEVAAELAPPLRRDPLAALLLESARLRLDGFGDRAAAGDRLREVVESYPGTWSAGQARKLLESLDSVEMER